MLLRCYYELSGNKATGVHKVTKKEYEYNLLANSDVLLNRMKYLKYRL